MSYKSDIMNVVITLTYMKMAKEIVIITIMLILINFVSGINILHEEEFSPENVRI